MNKDAIQAIRIVEEAGINLDAITKRGTTLRDDLLNASRYKVPSLYRNAVHDAQVEQLQSLDLYQWLKDFRAAGAVRYSLYRDANHGYIEYPDYAIQGTYW